MKLSIHAHLRYHFAQQTDVMLQLAVAALPDQQVAAASLDLAANIPIACNPGHGGVGERLWLSVCGDLALDYRAEVTVARSAANLSELSAARPSHLPGDTIDYLMPSRSCPSDQFHDLVSGEFGGLEGGASIAAMRDWIAQTLDYVPGSSHAGTTASDTLVQGQGVCRDYAHVLISMARAAWIPARYASVYALGVKPQDFHAVAQVFLDGAWHLIDATGMAVAAEMAIIGVGRDAADVPFLSSFGDAWINQQFVDVAQLAAAD